MTTLLLFQDVCDKIIYNRRRPASCPSPPSHRPSSPLEALTSRTSYQIMTSDHNSSTATNTTTTTTAATTSTTPYSVRAELPLTPPLTSYLLHLISIKRSNLCISADVHTSSALLRLAEDVGDYICVLKTHADIIDDFSERTIKGLREISRRKSFLIFEDRKFADIGSMTN